MLSEERPRLPLLCGILVAALTLGVFVCLIWLRQDAIDRSIIEDKKWKTKDDFVLKIALHILMFTTILRLCLLCTIQCFYQKQKHNQKFGTGLPGRLHEACSKWWFASCACAEVVGLTACAGLMSVPYGRQMDHEMALFICLFLSAMASVIAIALVATAWQWVNSLSRDECRVYPIGDDGVPMGV